jgi:hypothetical protein
MASASSVGFATEHVQLAAGERSQVVERQHVERVGHGDLERVAFARQRQHLRLTREVLGHQLHGFAAGGGELLHAGHAEPELPRQRLHDLRFGQVAQAHQRAPESLARIGACGQRVLHLSRGEAGVLDQQLAESRRR